MRYVPADRRLVAVVQHVFPFELRRVHSDLACDNVELAFVGKEPLRIARSAHVAAWDFVGVHHSFFDQAVGDSVRAGASRRADQIAGRLHRGIGSAVEKKVDVVGDDCAVFFDAGLNFNDRGMARVAGGQLLGVIHDHLDRPAALLG